MTSPLDKLASPSRGDPCRETSTRSHCVTSLECVTGAACRCVCGPCIVARAARAREVCGLCLKKGLSECGPQCEWSQTQAPAEREP